MIRVVSIDGTTVASIESSQDLGIARIRAAVLASLGSCADGDGQLHSLQFDLAPGA